MIPLVERRYWYLALALVAVMLDQAAVRQHKFDDLAQGQALGLLAELFPERRVVGIHSLDLVLGLGSVHCSTHHEPSLS